MLSPRYAVLLETTCALRMCFRGRQSSFLLLNTCNVQVLIASYITRTGQALHYQHTSKRLHRVCACAALLSERQWQLDFDSTWYFVFRSCTHNSTGHCRWAWPPSGGRGSSWPTGGTCRLASTSNPSEVSSWQTEVSDNFQIQMFFKITTGCPYFRINLEKSWK